MLTAVLTTARACETVSRLASRVALPQKSTDLWQVQGSDHQTISAPKVVVATNHTHPAIPILPRNDSFVRPIIHRKVFGEALTEVFEDPSMPNVTIPGGGKSGTDMVYGAATMYTMKR